MKWDGELNPVSSLIASTDFGVCSSMQEKPASLYGSGLGSNYQAQGLKLSKHFRI